MKVKFAVMADLHVDIMPDGVSRAQAFCEAAVKEQVDFLLHLGDIQYPEVAFLEKHAPESVSNRAGWFVCDRDDEKVAVRKLIAETGLPMYGVLGNHDMDSCSKQTACLYWNMPGTHYSFVQGGVRFIALDTNFIDTEEGMLDFDHCNYSQFSKRKTSFLTQPQLKWLEREIMQSAEPCVLLSHAPLGDDRMCIHDRVQLWEMIARVNQDKRRVILALNGHNHSDGVTVRQGIPFISINSISNVWIGHQYDAVRYSETICRHYPHLKGCAPYRDALYAIFEIDDDAIRMTGRESGFVGPSPRALGLPDGVFWHEPAPVIRSRVLKNAPLEGDGITDL